MPHLSKRLFYKKAKSYIKPNNSNPLEVIFNQFSTLKKEIEENEAIQNHFPSEAHNIAVQINESMSSILRAPPEKNTLITTLKYNQEELKALLKAVEKKQSNQQIAIAKAEDCVATFKAYIESNAFYPTPLLFKANMLEGKIQDLKDAKPTQWPNSMDILEKKLEEFVNDFKNFLFLKDEIEIYLKSNSKLDGNTSQDLLFAIQNNDFKTASKVFEKLKKSK